MAAGDISIVINSETKAFRQGVEAGIIDPLQDAEKALDDLGRSRAPDELERELRTAQRTTENLADETKRTARAIENEYRDSYRAAGRASDRFKIDASENMKGLRDESIQNLSEVASSWDGSVDQMAEGVQGLTGGLASALTPGIGIPVAILGAAAAAFGAAWQREAEATEERIAEMYSAMTEAGVTFLNDKFVNDKIVELAGDQETFNQAAERARDLGVETKDVLRAMAGDQATINELLSPRRQLLEDELDRIRQSGASLDEQQTQIDAANTAFSEQYGWLVKLVDEHGNAAERAWEANQAIRDGNDQMDRLVQKWRDIPKSQQLELNVTSNFDRVFNEMARKANAGIRVTLRADGSQGRAWQ